MFVFFPLSGASGSSGNRVDVGVAVFDAAVSFGRRSEDAKASEVEIKKIRRRIDAAQGAVKFEIVAGIDGRGLSGRRLLVGSVRCRAVYFPYVGRR